MYTEGYEGYTIEIYPDQCWESPRDWEPLSRLVLGHRRYDVPCELPIDFEEYSSWSEVLDALQQEYDIRIAAPIYLYEHGGLVLRLGHSFADIDPWGFDWGQLGWALVLADDIRKTYGVQRISRKALAKAQAAMEAEVEEYGQYLAGEVYCYDISSLDGEVVDSLCGLYGFDYALEEAREAIQFLLEEAAND